MQPEPSDESTDVATMEMVVEEEPPPWQANGPRGHTLLQMEVADEEPSVDQTTYFMKGERDFQEAMKKIDDLVEAGGEIIERNDNVVIVQTTTTGPAAPGATSSPSQAAGAPGVQGAAVSKPGQAKGGAAPGQTLVQVPGGVLLQQPVQSNLVARSGGNVPPGTYQLIMDPRMGVLVGSAVGSPGAGGIQMQGVPSLTVAGKNVTVTNPSIVGTAANTRTVYSSASATRGPGQQLVRAPVPAAAMNNSLTVTRTLTTASSSKPLNKVSPWVTSTATVNNVTTVTTATAGTSYRGTNIIRRGRGRGSFNLPALAPRSGVLDVANASAPIVDLTDEGPSVNASRPPPLTAITPRTPGVRLPIPRMAQSATSIRPSMQPGVRMNHAVRGRGGHAIRGRGGGRGASNASSSGSQDMSLAKQAKLYPSLVVMPKPTLRVRDFTAVTITKERSELDQMVKTILLYSTTKFTEWLIQQGLVRSSQICLTHKNSVTGEPVALKLGMYSDISKFPHSGGYVWICDFCSPQLFISVFSGSVFEGAPHSPMILLKLMYHWSCQTTIQNINQWVKVDNHYIKTFFTHMRAICTSAICENYEQMGGPAKRVEVGVISLGTAAPDGSSRQVKVEVLGIMDPDNKLIRLRAVDPLQEGEKNYKRRFVKILEPMAEWVHKKSIILTDFTVDKGTLNNMGFGSVYQVSVNPDNPDSSSGNKYSNINVMNYLRRVVPRMFQNTLSLLSRANIQQFLDELVWRERWGAIPSQAFNNALKHLSEQTRANKCPSFMKRLSRITANPFRDWKYVEDDEVEVIEPTSSPTPPNSHVASAPATSTALQPAAGTPSPSAASTVPYVQEIALRPSIDMLPQSIREPSPVRPSSPGYPRQRRKRPAETSLSLAGAPEPKRHVSKRTGPLASCPTGNTPAPALSATTPYIPTGEANTPLQAYYYGSLEGDPAIIHSETKNTFTLKCSACPKTFINNILLMKHLLLHVQAGNQFSSELSNLTQCKYCLRTFPTPFSMQTHVDEVHLTDASSSNTVCSICVEKFRDTTTLIQHMHRTHVALEMPYVCHICQFRSSMHRDLIDHFYDVHNNGEKLQCPFCLKVVAFASSGRRFASNISFFLAHMQKHSRRKLRKKCQRCALWFVSKNQLSDHLQRDHISFKNVSGVKGPKPAETEVIMMPLPPAELGPSASIASIRRGTARGRNTYLFTSLNIELDIPPDMRCLECKEDIDEEHFSGFMMCSMCRFSSCCNTAMQEHLRIFHETPGKPTFLIGRTINLPKAMFCACGYSSASGNRLTKHLCLCDRKSAYPTPDSARGASSQSASFPPLVTLDDADNVSEDPSDKWLKQFVPTRRDESENSTDTTEKKTLPSTEGGPPSMLNLLGLYRKPSTDESSLDKAPSDKEDAPPVKDTKDTKGPTDTKVKQTKSATEENDDIILDEKDDIILDEKDGAVQDEKEKAIQDDKEEDAMLDDKEEDAMLDDKEEDALLDDKGDDVLDKDDDVLNDKNDVALDDKDDAILDDKDDAILDDKDDAISDDKDDAILDDKDDILLEDKLEVILDEEEEDSPKGGKEDDVVKAKDEEEKKSEEKEKVPVDGMDDVIVD